MDYSGRLLPEELPLSREAVRALAEARELEVRELGAGALAVRDEIARRGEIGVMEPLPVASPQTMRMFPEHLVILAMMLASVAGGALALLH